VQNTYNLYWNLTEIQFRLKETMHRAFDRVYEMSQNSRIHMRNAAYLVAVARVAEACKLRGWT
jgi:glutamate dehydrogenase (NAD(P)+)